LQDPPLKWIHFRWLHNLTQKSTWNVDKSYLGPMHGKLSLRV